MKLPPLLIDLNISHELFIEGLKEPGQDCKSGDKVVIKNHYFISKSGVTGKE